MKKIIFVFVIGMITFMFSSCSEDSPVVQPSTLSTYPTAFIGVPLVNNMVKHLQSCFPNMTNAADENARIIVIFERRLSNVSAFDREAIKRVFDANGIIICVDPYYSEFVTFLHEDLEHEFGYPYTENNGQFCEFVAFNRAGCIYLQDYFEPEEGRPVLLTHSAENPDSLLPDVDHNGSIKFHFAEFSNTEFKQAMQPLRDWIIRVTTIGNQSSSKKISETFQQSPNIVELANCQVIVHTFPISLKMTTKSNLAYIKNMNITITTDVWAAYDKSNDRDYYCVWQLVTIPNSNMYFGKTTGKQNNLYNKSYATYMKGFSINNRITNYNSVNIPNVVLQSYSPYTANNVATVSTTIGFTVGASGSFQFSGPNAGPSVGLNGSFSFSKTNSYSIADVGMVSKTADDGVNTKWEYTTNRTPSFKAACTWKQDAAALAINTASFEHAWVWQVNNAKTTAGGAMGQFCITIEPWYQCEEKYYWGCAGSGNERQWGYTGTKTRYLLNAPPRM